MRRLEEEREGKEDGGRDVRGERGGEGRERGAREEQERGGEGKVEGGR